MLEIGSLVDGKYKVLNKIGQGGMSVVYLAMNERANKQWAIKEVRKDGTQDHQTVTQGLIAEINILKGLNHPGLPSIIDVIDTQDTFLVVMDYIEGNGLDKTLRDHGAQPEALVIDWAKQLCSILGYLHSKGIIYRDMKPANVMLKPDGQLVLIDFGTAKTFKGNKIQDTTCLGTIGYAAPEQFGGRGESDARTDIYCLGATLYHLVTGLDPSKELHMYPIREKNPALSEGLEQLISKCTMVEPVDRYQSCAELLYALNNLDQLIPKYRKQQKKRMNAFIASTVSSLVFLIGAIGFHLASVGTQANIYADYLDKAAKNISNKEYAVECYKEAVILDPARSDAYLAVIKDVFLADGKLSDSEVDALVKITGYYEQDRDNTALNQLKKSNPAGYEEVIYEIGSAYYYYGNNGAGNKTDAKAYLEEASKGSFLDEDSRSRAAMLYQLCSLSAQLGRVDPTGSTTSEVYQEMWEALDELSTGNLVEKDNTYTALYVYKEVLYELNEYGIYFRNVGIGYEELMAKVNNIASRLETDIAISENDEYGTQLKKTVTEMVETTSKALSVAYGQGGAA